MTGQSNATNKIRVGWGGLVAVLLLAWPAAHPRIRHGSPGACALFVDTAWAR